MKIAAHAGPELGPLASLMVAPEEGSWRVDEVTVSSSRSRHTDRFVCRDALGRSGQSMGFMAPVPQDAVVYGSGESAVVLTRVGCCALYLDNHPQNLTLHCSPTLKVVLTVESCDMGEGCSSPRTHSEFHAVL